MATTTCATRQHWVVGLASTALVVGFFAPPVTALATPPSENGAISVDVSTGASTSRFVGKVTGGPKEGTVILQRKKADGGWRQVASSDYTRKGFAVAYAAHGGSYRIKVPLRTWYNHTRWFERVKGWRWDGPASVRSDSLTVAPGSQAGDPVKWVIGLGDSYASGEGATYAGYGPWKGADHGWFTQTDNWWISAFGSRLEDTYAGAYHQPIVQPGLAGRQSDYEVPLSGTRCHRSASAMMYWNQPGYAAVNLACSGATSATDVKSGKPGIDFTVDGSIVGQAEQLKRFAKQVMAKGDQISVVSYSIGGNDVGFADIVEDCVERFATPGKYGCGKRESDSKMQKAYDNGRGLTKARTAVVNSGENIIQALTDAGVPKSSYVLALQTPPLGIPPANQFESDFGGNSGWGRQGIGGCGFTDADLDFVNGPFGALLRSRFLEGAKELSAKHRDIRLTVTDVTNAFADHQLCSNRVTYPTTRSHGDNTLTPGWASAWGGKTGTWMTPIIGCATEGTIGDAMCVGDFGPMWLNYPTLMTAMNCVVQTSGKCNKEAYENVRQLPMHPNYWGQRALAGCHSQTATNPDFVGKVVECRPGSRSLDAYNRPNMTTRSLGPIG